MDTFLKGKSFEVELTLKYADTETVIDLGAVTDIEILLRHKSSKTTLVERKYSDGEITLTDAVNGKCSLYVNGSDTSSAEEGYYEYVATIVDDNSYFDDSTADFGAFGDAFILQD